jgi:hypothetical protein
MRSVGRAGVFVVLRLLACRAEEGAESAQDDADVLADCDPVGSSLSCLGFLIKEQTISDERDWASVSAGGK